MKPPVIVDTNVPLTANGDATHATFECQLNCITKLEDVQREQILLLDEDGHILEEYTNQKPYGFPQGSGDLFMIWANDNQANPEFCRLVPIMPLFNAEREFAEFPDDPALRGFDRSDQKFVAVALASGEQPVILNATDSDWRLFEEPLQEHGVHIQHICP